MRSARLTVQSVIDAVELSLRDQILDQEISSGETVRETEVARVFDVARPTAKAAIERLVVSGLLTRDAHKSARVPLLSNDDVSDLYFSRAVLEEGVVRRLAANKNLPEVARNAIDAMRSLGTAGLPKQYAAPDIEFHVAMTRYLGSERLTRMHVGLMGEMRFCMAQVQAHDLLSPTLIIEEHERIASAILDGKPDRAALEVRDHLERARDALVRFLASSAASAQET